MTGAGDHFLQNDTLGQISLLVWSLPGTAFNLKNLLLRRAEVDVIFKPVLEDAGFVEVYQEQFDAIAANDPALQKRIRCKIHLSTMEPPANLSANVGHLNPN